MSADPLGGALRPWGAGALGGGGGLEPGGDGTDVRSERESGGQPVYGFVFSWEIYILLMEYG